MDIFTQLAIVLGLSASFGLVAKLLKQPVLLGYITAGVLISTLGWTGGIGEGGLVTVLGQLGVTLLLFLVGLEMPLAQMKQTGKVALATGLGQLLFTAGVGYPILLALGFSPLPSLYLAIALAFSSTIIVIKLLTEKKDLQSLHGKIAVGFLLVQDFVAIGILIMLAGLGGESGQVDWLNLAVVVTKGIALVALALWLSGKVFPKVIGWLGDSTEMLFVMAIAWCVSVATMVAAPPIGFSLEIGGFLAGLALSGAAQHLQIGARVRPLRDFFLTLFFVSLGASIHIADLSRVWLPAVVLSAFVLVGNPIIVMLIMRLLKFKSRTSFLASITVAQISEFSLIVMAAAARVGHVGQYEVAVTAVVGAITMVLSTYMILNGTGLYKLFWPILRLFEVHHAPHAEISGEEKLENHIVLFGHNRVGAVLLPALQKLGQKVVVVDFNPATVEELSRLGKHAVYGDLADVDLYDDLALGSAKMIVSTVTDLEDNLQCLQYLHASHHRPLVIVTADDAVSADSLYLAGADFVLIPHSVGGQYLAHVLSQHGIDKAAIRKLRG